MQSTSALDAAIAACGGGSAWVLKDYVRYNQDNLAVLGPLLRELLYGASETPPGQVNVIDSAIVLQTILSRCRSVKMGQVFCGTLPASITRADVESGVLRRSSYVVSPKLDGTRMLLLVDVLGNVWGMDRALHVSHLGRVASGSPLGDTVLDVELMMLTREIHVLDSLCVHGRCLREEPSLSARLHEAAPVIASLVASAGQNGNLWASAALQRYVPVRGVDEDILVALMRGATRCDGLVFTPEREPYRPGFCPSLLKWKCDGQDTVDLLVRGQGALVYCQGRNGEEVAVGTVDGLPEGLLDASGSLVAVVECVLESGRVGENRSEWRWRFSRLRPDKRSPNFIGVLENVLESAASGLTPADFCPLKKL